MKWAVLYLDHNATTPILPEVREAIMQCLDSWGNPSSSYKFGGRLRSDIERARESVANLVGAKYPQEIVLTSGGTESNNTAIHSAVLANPAKKNLVISCAEHSSVLSYCYHLERNFGYSITFVPVDVEGLTSPEDVEKSITNDTAIVSIMWANNETGVLSLVDEIGKICKDRRVIYHCDAVQAVGKIPVNVNEINCDYLSLTGHKIGCPKGVGALYVKRNTKYTSFVLGGHQERGRRGGTENVSNVIALGVAAEIALRNMDFYSNCSSSMRDHLEAEIVHAFSAAEVNGKKTQRLPNTTNIWFKGIDSSALLVLLDQEEICASSGSACLADSPEPSHVINAMKGSEAAHQSIRFSIDHRLRKDDVSFLIEVLRRSISGLAELEADLV